jgi:hypothetical protein
MHIYIIPGMEGVHYKGKGRAKKSSILFALAEAEDGGRRKRREARARWPGFVWYPLGFLSISMGTTTSSPNTVCVYCTTLPLLYLAQNLSCQSQHSMKDASLAYHHFTTLIDVLGPLFPQPSPVVPTQINLVSWKKLGISEGIRNLKF